MGQKDHGKLWGEPLERTVEILTALLPSEGSAMIVDTDNRNSSGSTSENPIFVPKNRETQVAHTIRPIVGSGVVIVIARDEKDAFATAQSREGVHFGVQVFDAAVDEVSGHGDDIGLECVDRIDETRRKRTPQQGPNMDVADLNDAQPVAFPRPSRQMDFNPANPRK